MELGYICVHASLSVAHAILSSLTPYKLNLPEVQRDRCLGTAVEVALAIIQGPSAEMSRGVIKRPGGNSPACFGKLLANYYRIVPFRRPR